MMHYNNKNGKKYKIKEIDSETMTLSENTEKKKENLIIKKIPKIVFYSLFVIFIILLVGLIAFKIKFNHINKNIIKILQKQILL